MSKKEGNTSSKSSAIKQWGSNTLNKCKNIEGKYWANIAVWILTLMMLIVVIVIAALKTNLTSSLGDIGYSNVIAGVVLGFSFLLVGAIIHIVSIKLWHKRKGGK